MRGRIVLFFVLAVTVALLGVYLGRSTTTPTAVGEPATTTQADSSVGPTQRRGSGSGPSRSPASSSPKASQQKAPPPKTSPPKACSPQAAAQPAAYTTPSGQEPQTEPASQPQPNTDPVRFGTPTTTPSGNNITDLTPDRRAFSVAFSDRIVQVGPGSTHCDATKSFTLTLPLTDGAKGDTLRIDVLGTYIFSDEHATARLTLRLNGQVTVTDFPAGANEGKDFVQTLRVPATPATTHRLSGVFEVHQDPGTGGSALLNVASIEAAID